MDFDYRKGNLYQLSIFWAILCTALKITEKPEKQKIAQDYVAELVDDGIVMASDILREAITAIDMGD